MSLFVRVGEMQNMLYKTKLSSNVGVVLQMKESAADVIVSLLVNRIHLEIFGEMFPYDLLVLNESLKWIRAVYPGALVYYISQTNSEIQLRYTAISSEFNAPREIIILEKIVLERFAIVKEGIFIVGYLK